jgi:hypothetical protein
MSKITLHRDDVEAILSLMNELCETSESCVEIEVDNSSGIGATVTAKIPMKCGNYVGDFVTEISGVENW